MAPSVQRYFQDGLASSTQRTYSAELKHFHKFCVQLVLGYETISGHQTPPLRHSWLTKASPLRQGNCTSLRIGVCKSHWASEILGNTPLPILKRVQAGICRARLLCGTPPRIRLPITISMLAQIRRILDTLSNPRKVVIWAIACTAFFGFFRLGEFLMDVKDAFNPAVNLAWGDVAVDNQENPQKI